MLKEKRPGPGPGPGQESLGAAATATHQGKQPLDLAFLTKYTFQYEQIHFAIWTNTLGNLDDKYTLKTGQESLSAVATAAQGKQFRLSLIAAVTLFLFLPIKYKA